MCYNQKKRVIFMLKKIIGVFLVLLLCGCGAAEPAENTVMIGNPFTTCETLAEAEELLGYSLEIPEELAGYDSVIYRAADSETLSLLEVIFEGEGNEIRLRKSPGTEDNSGVYGEFAIAVENADGERGLVMKGDGDGAYRLAIWQDGEYSYSISCEKGVEQETLYGWVCSTK